MLDPDVRRAFGGASIAHLATVLPDGSPHVVPVFVGVAGDRIAVFTGPDSRKARNLRQDPRIALSVAPADGPFQPVVVRGRVVDWIEDESRWELIDRIALPYLGGPYPRDLDRIVMIIEPEQQLVGVR